MQSVLATPVFEADVRRAGLSDQEIELIVDRIAAHPLSGDLIVGTGGARKLRHRRRGGGKSGGYRTVHYYAGEDVPIFLLALIDKGQRADLSQAERNAVAKELADLADAYRRGVAKLAEARKRRE